MEAILGLIVAGAIARTGGMWGLTRVAVAATVMYAILLDFTALRPALEPASRWVWVGMLVLWVANLIATRRTEPV
jgi:hypothetical protein